MTLTINNFSDLLHIVETRPEWRHKLIKALFPEIDVPKAFQDLADSQKIANAWLERLSTSYDQLDARNSRMETDVAEIKADVAELKTDVVELKTDMKDYRDKAISIFGRYLQRGRDVTSEVADQLRTAEDAGKITEQEFDQVLATDLLWEGQLRRTEDKVILVIETSWLAEIADVERAVTRANILRRIGLRALPVVAGREWTEEANEAAREQKVVMTTNGLVDKTSWQDASTSCQ
jgi:uncharacterized protein YdcH (DUF465 family)